METFNRWFEASNQTTCITTAPLTPPASTDGFSLRWVSLIDPRMLEERSCLILVTERCSSSSSCSGAALGPAGLQCELGLFPSVDGRSGLSDGLHLWVGLQPQVSWVQNQPPVVLKYSRHSGLGVRSRSKFVCRNGTASLSVFQMLCVS